MHYFGKGLNYWEYTFSKFLFEVHIYCSFQATPVLGANVGNETVACLNDHADSLQTSVSLTQKKRLDITLKVINGA